jgi:hypothetical protein
MPMTARSDRQEEVKFPATEQRNSSTEHKDVPGQTGERKIETNRVRVDTGQVVLGVSMQKCRKG